MDDITLYLPFTKQDNDQRIVSGYATTEAIDSQGEIVKSDAIEKALPEYMKFGNIREMHQWSAVGKTISAKMDESKKGLFIKGKIVDSEAWQKVKEKVYSGFSIGGKVLKKMGNVIHELSLNEISLVDRPSNPEAVFSLVKIEGGDVVEKQFPIAPTDMTTTETHPGIRTADRLIAMSSSLLYLISDASALNRPTKHIEKVLQALKQAALVELESEKVAITKRVEEEKKSREVQVDALGEEVRKVVMEKTIDPVWSASYFSKLREVL